MDTSSVKEEKARCVFTADSKTKESSIISKDLAMVDAVRTYDSILTKAPDNMMGSSSLLSKPSHSYIALIAKVILSSPSQKLNLGSIYRAMEEQFPYLRSRGPGWRNSVRHNLSVNDCFVKVSRCEDGRGHYWGVHQAHLRDFQLGNFRQYKSTRSRRESWRYESVAGLLALMETSCFLGRFCERGSESLAWVVPQCPLQEPQRNQMSSSDWTQPCYQPWSISVDWVQSPSWARPYYCPKMLPDSYGRPTAGRRHDGQPLTSRPHCWEINDPVLKGMTESYDSRFSRPPAAFCCKELINPLPYKVNFPKALN